MSKRPTDERWLDCVAFWINAGMDKWGAENMADFEAYLCGDPYFKPPTTNPKQERTDDR